MRYALLLMICLQILACHSPTNKKRQKVIESLIITDFAVEDTTFSHSVFLKVRGGVDTTVCENGQILGFVSSSRTNSNFVFKDVYGCQRSFTAISVPFDIHNELSGQSFTYYKIGFNGIKNYHNAEMILKMHAEFIASNFILVTANHPRQIMAKVDNFKIYSSEYGKLVEIE